MNVTLIMALLTVFSC